MPILDIVQTATIYLVSYPNAGCTGRTLLAGSVAAHTCIRNGTPSGTGLSSVLTSSATLIISAPVWVCQIPTATSWDAGTWTWRLNVTAANMNITLNEVYICRMSSANVNLGTIGSSTGLSISLGTTGVKSGTISGSAQTPTGGNYVAIFFVYTNGAMSNQNFTYLADQTINTPFIVSDRSPVTISVGHPFIV